MRAQGGSGGDCVFSVVPSCFLIRLRHFHSLCFQPRASADVAVQLILVVTFVQYARTAGVLGTRGSAVEVAAARICREAGARAKTNILVRDMDLGAAVENQTRDQDQRCQSGPSANNSIIFSEGDLQRIMKQTNNDYRILIFISTNSPHQQRLLVGSFHSRLRYELVRNFLRKRCNGSKKWSWLMQWMN